MLYLQTHKPITRKDPTLQLGYLRLKSISEVFQDNSILSTHLRKLDLSHNLLLEIPQIIFTLKNLIELNLSYNGITIVSSNIKSLQKLQILDLDYNKIDLPPYSIALLPNLQNLKCHNNPLSYLPSNVRDKNSSIMEFLSTESTEKQLDRIKLMVVGAEKSGKTSLVKNLKKENFLTPTTTRRLSELAPRVNEDDSFIKVSEFSLPGNKTLLSVWDIGTKDVSFFHFYLFKKGIRLSL